MNELHRFMFEGAPVRGVAVRLEESWREMLACRASQQAYPPALAQLLGQMAAAALLMQSNIKFNGSLILQIMGDGPVKLAVAQAQTDLGFRCTAKFSGSVAPDTSLADMVNLNGQARCAITLEPQDRLPGQQPYQGMVQLPETRQSNSGLVLAQVLEHYMQQSEQLETCLVLAADEQVAAGLLLQRVAHQGGYAAQPQELGTSTDEDGYQRLAVLTRSLTATELLRLPTLEVLHRLFWQEKLLRHAPQTGASGPHFACNCSRERVASMLRSLGQVEANSILAEQGDIQVGCDFCGRHYSFDTVDVAQLFMPDRSMTQGQGGQSGLMH